MRIVQYLQSLEKKGLILRTKEGKMHFFTRTNNQVHPIRNYRDVENAIQKEFSIKISYTEIRKALAKSIIHQGRSDHTINELTKKGLLTLQYDSPKTIPLIRVL